MRNLSLYLLEDSFKKNYGSCNNFQIDKNSLPYIENNIIQQIIDYYLIGVIFFMNILIILSVYIENNNLCYLGIWLEIMISLNITLVYYTYQNLLGYNCKIKYNELIKKYYDNPDDFSNKYGLYLENLYNINCNNRVILVSNLNLNKNPELFISIILSLKYNYNLKLLTYKDIILNSLLIFLGINLINLTILVSSLYNILLGIGVFLIFLLSLIIISIYRCDKHFFYVVNITAIVIINTLFLIIPIDIINSKKIPIN